jgi:uncharacterized protein YggE
MVKPHGPRFLEQEDLLMYRPCLVIMTTLFAFIVVELAVAQAEAAESGTVAAVGTVNLKRRPDRLRVKLDVFATGKTMNEAIANFKDRRQAVRGQLATLGAVKESISFGEPQANSTVLEARQQMEMMIRQRIGKAAKKDAKKAATAPSVVSASLTAEWSLRGQDTEALLIEIAQLRESITATDIAGRKDLEKVGSEDEELKEEMEGVEIDANQTGQTPPGTPTFLLVSKVTEEDRARALVVAFQKAKASAERTAKAAGAGLGPVRQIESQFQSSPESDNQETAVIAYARSMQAARPEPQPDPDGPLEAQGNQPGTVSLRVTVTATFTLNPGP